jgi:hypothetical protein
VALENFRPDASEDVLTMADRASASKPRRDERFKSASDAIGRGLWGAGKVPAMLTGLVGFPLAALGFLIGVAIVRVNQSAQDQERLSKPEFVIWTVMIGAFVALALICFLYSRAILTDLRNKFSQSADWRLHLWYLIFAAIIFVGLSAFRAPIDPFMTRLGPRTTIILLIGLISVWPAFCGMWLIQSALIAMKIRIDPPGPSAGQPGTKEKLGEILSDLVYVRRILLTLLLAVASVIGLTVLATSALRNAILVGVPKDAQASKFPITYVVLYGLFFTVVLGLVYTPAYLALQARGRQFVDKVHPIPESGQLKGEEYTGRQTLEKALQLDVSVKESLQTGIAILGPLGASLVSTLFPSPK